MQRTCVAIILVGLTAATSIHTTHAQGGGGGAGGGTGGGAASSGTAGSAAVGTGSAGDVGGAASGRVGGGPPAGQVGGGPPAGQVGGGAPAPNNASGANAEPVRPSPDHPAAGLENAPTTGGVIGGTTDVPPKGNEAGGAAPPAQANPQRSVQGGTAASGTRADPSERVVREKPVKPRPCSISAHETDGTTTCIGIKAR
jgi:hypothetical protein